MLDAAARGLGLAYAMDVICRPWLEDGRLVQVLADWSPRYPGFCLYYPNRRITAPLRAGGDVEGQLTDALSGIQACPARNSVKNNTTDSGRVLSILFGNNFVALQTHIVVNLTFYGLR